MSDDVESLKPTLRQYRWSDASAYSLPTSTAATRQTRPKNHNQQHNKHHSSRPPHLRSKNGGSTCLPGPLASAYNWVTKKRKARKRRRQQLQYMVQPVVKALGLTKRQANALVSYYMAMDADGSGAVSLMEFFRHFDVARTPFTKRAFAMFDIDGDGGLDCAEFMAGTCAYCARDSEGLLAFAYDLIDTAGDGVLDVKEVRNLLLAVYGADASRSRLAQGVLDSLTRASRRSGGSRRSSTRSVGSRRGSAHSVQSHASAAATAAAARSGLVVSKETFIEWGGSHPTLLYPAFELQRQLQSKMGGLRFWSGVKRQIEGKHGWGKGRGSSRVSPEELGSDEGEGYIGAQPQHSAMAKLLRAVVQAQERGRVHPPSDATGARYAVAANLPRAPSLHGQLVFVDANDNSTAPNNSRRSSRRSASTSPSRASQRSSRRSVGASSHASRRSSRRSVGSSAERGSRASRRSVAGSERRGGRRRSSAASRHSIIELSPEPRRSSRPSGHSRRGNHSQGSSNQWASRRSTAGRGWEFVEPDNQGDSQSTRDVVAAVLSTDSEASDGEAVAPASGGAKASPPILTHASSTSLVSPEMGPTLSQLSLVGSSMDALPEEEASPGLAGPNARRSNPSASSVAQGRRRKSRSLYRSDSSGNSGNSRRLSRKSSGASTLILDEAGVRRSGSRRRSSSTHLTAAALAAPGLASDHIARRRRPPRGSDASHEDVSTKRHRQHAPPTEEKQLRIRSASSDLSDNSDTEGAVAKFTSSRRISVDAHHPPTSVSQRTLPKRAPLGHLIANYLS